MQKQSSPSKRSASFGVKTIARRKLSAFAWQKARAKFIPSFGGDNSLLLELLYHAPWNPPPPALLLLHHLPPRIPPPPPPPSTLLLHHLPPPSFVDQRPKRPAPRSKSNFSFVIGNAASGRAGRIRPRFFRRTNQPTNERASERLCQFTSGLGFAALRISPLVKLEVTLGSPNREDQTAFAILYSLHFADLASSFLLASDSF